MINQVISILFPVFALAMVGFAIGRLLKPDFRPINRINMDVFAPALVFTSLVTMPLGSAQLPLLAAGAIAVLVPGLLMYGYCQVTKLNFKAWAPVHMFRNSGNLAIPLFTYTFGDLALAPAVLLFVISACLHITLGLALLSNGNPFKQVVKMPIFIAAAAALVINLSDLTVWSPILDASQLLGQAAIPVMLISLGSQMVNLRLSGLKVGILCTIQSLITGAIAFGLIYWLVPLSTLELQMMILFSLLPPAVMNYLFAERFDIEANKVAAMVLFGNFFGVLTLPVLLSIALSLAT